MPGFVIFYVKWVDFVSEKVGRATMFLVFIMIGTLLLNAITRNVLNIPLSWCVEMAQFTMAAYYSRYGLVPVTLPWDDIEVAIQTGELDGVAWCGLTEAYEVGWADVCNYALLNNVTGAWCGSYFANTDSWNKVPPHLQELFKLSMDSSHYYRQVWYWGGEAKLRVEGKKMELTTIPAAEWDQVVEDSKEFWDELSSISPRAAKVVQIFKDYSKVMEQAGVPYRYS